MAIRSATEDDIDGVRRVAEASWERDHPGVVTRETAREAVDDWYTPDRLEAALHRGRVLLLVAERDGRIAGFAHATWTDADEMGHILRLYVHPDSRRAGVGGRLLEATCTELFDLGLDRITATVLVENEIGNEFYRSFGFEPDGEEETTIGEETHRENRYLLEDPSTLR